MAGANVLYGMGMLDMGMTFSYTQLLLDNEIANMVNHVTRGVEVTDVTMAVDTIREVIGSPVNHFLMEEHTLEYMKEQSQPAIFNRLSRGNWISAGAEDAAALATKKAQQIFFNHKPQALDAIVLEELKRIVDSVK